MALCVTESAEFVVRGCMAASPRWQVDELSGFLADDAAWVDGHNDRCVGIDAIKARLEAIGRLLPGPTVEVRNLPATGRTVMVERIDVIRFKASHSTLRSPVYSTSTATGEFSGGAITTTPERSMRASSRCCAHGSNRCGNSTWRVAVVSLRAERSHCRSAAARIKSTVPPNNSFAKQDALRAEPEGSPSIPRRER